MGFPLSWPPDLIAPEVVPGGLAWWPLVAVVLALVVINIVNNRVAPQAHYLLWSFGGAVILVAIGLLDGASFTDLGLSWRYWIPGLLWAAICIGVVTAIYVIGSIFRRTRKAFHDERMRGLTGTGLAFQALIEVPLGTVLFEEIAFRSVLFAMLARRYGIVWALVVSSLLFGLWHVLPSIGTHEQNAALGAVVGSGRRGNILAVTLSVFTTAISGVLFGFLRLVSGSVIAPMGLHWATNGLGYAFSWSLLRVADRRRARHRQELERRRAERDVAG